MFEDLDGGWVAGLCLDEPAAELFGWPVTLAEVVAGPAGLELAAVLASVGDPAGLDDADLVEVLAGWERLAAHVSACQASVLAELAARRPAVPGEPAGNVPGVSRFAGDEVAVALGVSRVTGESRLRDAVLLAGDLPGVLEAARDGRMAWSAARAVAEEVVVLPEGDRAAVGEFVLARCAGRTPGQLRRLARRAVLGVDPAGAAQRQERAVAGRGVARWDTPDGMAEVCARLAPQDAATVWDTLTGLARACATPGDSRGLDARRADVLVGVFTAIATGTPLPGPPGLPARRARCRPGWPGASPRMRPGGGC